MKHDQLHTYRINDTPRMMNDKISQEWLACSFDALLILFERELVAATNESINLNMRRRSFNKFAWNIKEDRYYIGSRQKCHYLQLFRVLEREKKQNMMYLH